MHQVQVRQVNQTLVHLKQKPYSKQNSAKPPVPRKENEKSELKKKKKKNLIIELIKQFKPGLELYRIPVPSFLLEPRSLLEILSDYARPNPMMIK